MELCVLPSVTQKQHKMAIFCLFLSTDSIFYEKNTKFLSLVFISFKLKLRHWCIVNILLIFLLLKVIRWFGSYACILTKLNRGKQCCQRGKWSRQLWPGTGRYSVDSGPPFRRSARLNRNPNPNPTLTLTLIPGMADPRNGGPVPFRQPLFWQNASEKAQRTLTLILTRTLTLTHCIIHL